MARRQLFALCAAFFVGVIYGSIALPAELELPNQVWNHIGPDDIGLIAPASALWGRRFIISGGSDGFANKSNVWDLQINLTKNDWTITPETLESMFHTRSHHTSNVYRDYLFTFGGNHEGLEIQQLANGDEHVIFHGPGPNKRVGHTAVLYDESLYLYGGFDIDTHSYSNELWRADVRYENLHWELVELDTQAGARAGHTAIIYQDSMYIFGGQNEDGYKNDVWRFSFQTRLWVRTFDWFKECDMPSPRVGHSAVYWSDEAMWVFGGYGPDGNFKNDMWRFDLQLGEWTQIFQGIEAGYNDDTFDVPSQRAFFAYTVFSGKLIVTGGQVGMGGVKEVFWSPQTRYVPIYHPDDFAGDVWAWDFCTKTWEFIGCLPPWEDTNVTSPAECRSHYKPVCPNDCSGNGVCVRDGHCICRGQWTNDDCSWNACYYHPILGYDVNLMDRILIVESILNLGKRLVELRDKLMYIQRRLPPFDEFTSCVKFNPVIAEFIRNLAATDGLAFTNELESSVMPIIDEFNDCLVSTNTGSDLQYHF